MDFIKEKHPLLLLIILLGFFIAGLFISQFFIVVSLYPVLGEKVLSLGSAISNPTGNEGYRGILLYVQGCTSAISMILAPLLFINNYYRKRINFTNPFPNEILFFLMAGIVIVSMPANAWVAEKNMAMELPSVFSFFENWAKSKENELKILTEYLTNFETNTQFLWGLVVIALIPAVGEELLFRGCMQNIFQDWFKNKHLAVWTAAFIFSAIHLQFYGFFPRMLLGALFGYLYVWSGSLLIPITGHFVNNGFTLALIHAKNINHLDVDLETTRDIPFSLIIFSIVSTVSMLYIFYKKSDK